MSREMNQKDGLQAWVGAQDEARMAEQGGPRPLQVLALASGKGGVGKTSLVVNLAVALARGGERVLVVDGDLGLANADILFGITPQYTLMDLLEGQASMDSVLMDAGGGVALLPACSGRYELANASDAERHTIFAQVDTLEARFDRLIIDTGPGLGTNAVAFAAAAQQVVVVVSSEPASLADAYGFIKVLHTRGAVKQVALVANMVQSAREGEAVYARLAALTERFLGVGIRYLGPVFRDEAMARAGRSGVPLLRREPAAQASRCIDALATKVKSMQARGLSSGGVSLFWKRLAGWRATA